MLHCLPIHAAAKIKEVVIPLGARKPYKGLLQNSLSQLPDSRCKNPHLLALPAPQLSSNCALLHAISAPIPPIKGAEIALRLAPSM